MPNLKYLFHFVFLALLNLSVFTQSWVQQTSGTNLNLNVIQTYDINTCYIGADSGKVLRTSNGGVNWEIINTGFNFNIINLEFFSPNLGIAAGEKVIKTTNGGISWITILDTAFANDAVIWNTNTIYIISTLPHSNKKTTDQGSSWYNFGSFNIIHMSIYFAYQNIGWIASKTPSSGGYVSQNISKTTNDGMIWSSQYTGILQNGNGWINNLAFNDTLNGYSLCIENGTPKILKTTNGGTNWYSINVQYSQKGICSNSNPVWWSCGSNGSVMKTLNGGNSWVTEQVPNTSIDLNSIKFYNSETGWVCGTSGIIYKSTNGGITELTPNYHKIPEAFVLSQNYPNPFNPVTNIKFDLPVKGFIRLVIYDQLGRESALLVNKELNAGTYSYDWDASNYPSGIYYYKLLAGDYTDTKKMILIK